MQGKLFSRNRIGEVPKESGFSGLLLESHGIVKKAIVDNDPYAIVLMLSGGDDSITALTVAKMLGVKIDFIIHGVTGTGLPVVRKYVNQVADRSKIHLLEANAGRTFEDYVKRKGFFGKGNDAHKFSYHLLKVNPFDKIISKHLRKGVKGRKIILLNGVRVEESENRADNFGDNPYREVRGNIWVNIVHWFTKSNCLDLLQQEKFERSPVAVALGRSGECNCGTMQSLAQLMQAGEFDPEWWQWLLSIRKYAVQKFGWDINQQPNKKTLAEIKELAKPVDDYMPMCVGCKAIQNRLFTE